MNYPVCEVFYALSHVKFKSKVQLKIIIDKLYKVKFHKNNKVIIFFYVLNYYL